MKFGRKRSANDQDKFYPMALRLRAVPPPVRKLWAISSKHLDQGDTSTCVGHAWKNFLRCAPLQTSTGPSAFDVYRQAVLLDEWPGNDIEAKLPDNDPKLESGTSVRAGAQAVTADGRLQSYLWAHTLAPAVLWVLTQGPVVLGTDWYDSLMNPDAAGVVKIVPRAKVVGGHAYLWRGVDTKTGMARCTNSWGNDWALKGDFLIPLADLEKLILNGGEACTAVEKKFKL